MMPTYWSEWGQTMAIPLLNPWVLPWSCPCIGLRYCDIAAPSHGLFAGYCWVRPGQWGGRLHAAIYISHGSKDRGWQQHWTDEIATIIGLAISKKGRSTSCINVAIHYLSCINVTINSAAWMWFYTNWAVLLQLCIMLSECHEASIELK